MTPAPPYLPDAGQLATVSGDPVRAAHDLDWRIQLLYKGAPLIGLVSNPSLLLSIFLPNVLIGLLIPSIGEEPGWRGFTLPGLQKLYGPILGTLILGTLHGIWHLPALLTPMFDPFTIS